MSLGRGVVFDATGTLFEASEPVGEVYSRVARAHGVDLPAWRLEDGFRRILRQAAPRGTQGSDEAARREGEVGWWFEVIRQTFQATDSTARFSDFPKFARALFDAYRLPEAWRIRPGVREALRCLADASVPTGIVSNFDYRLQEILEGLEILSFFSSIEIPSRVGAAKPDPRLFQAAAGALGQPLECLVYVGDDPPERLQAIGALGLEVLDVQGLAEPGRLAEELFARLELEASEPKSRS